MSVQCCRCGQNDEECNKIGESHSQISVDTDSSQLFLRLRWRALQRFLPAVVPDLFHFLRSLPEKQIWTDRGTENGNEPCEISLRQLNLRQSGCPNYRGPGNMSQKNDTDISKQRNRQPFKVLRIGRIWDEQDSRQ